MMCGMSPREGIMICAGRATLVPAILSLCCCIAAWAEEPRVDESGADLESLVGKLGAASFAVREQATAELIASGTAALATLEKAQSSADRETRLRAVKIATAIHKADFDKRLAAFASGASEANDAALPGWRAYRDVVGDDPAARSLFVEMQRAEGELLAAAARPGAGVAQQLLEARLKEVVLALQESSEEAAPAVVAACLWTATEERVNLTEEAVASLFALCHQANLKAALADSQDSPLRRLLGGVIRRTDGPSAYPALALALNFSLDDGLAPAERALKQETAQPQLLQYAIITIARFGERRHTPLLERQFANDARCASYRADDVERVTEVRDLALAAAIHLAGADLRDFGFEHVQTQSPTVFAPASLGFAGEKDRDAAFQKWADYRRVH
jgi:hypothetical protein